MEHVVIRRLEHLTGNAQRPDLGYAIEMRERPGPAHKAGAFPDDVVWIQLHGGLFVARAHVEICWRGEYSLPKEIRARTRGSELHGLIDFWRRRAKSGYAAVARLSHETWIEQPFWAGPRTYGYEWVLLDNEKKHDSWLTKREPPRSTELRADFVAWRKARP